MMQKARDVHTSSAADVTSSIDFDIQDLEHEFQFDTEDSFDLPFGEV